MFQCTWSAEDQRALDAVAKKIGIDLQARELAGEEATFASMETAASKIGQAVTRHVMEELAIQQTRLHDQDQPCPACQELWPVKVTDRTLTTTEGPIDLPETVCHCSACRRDLFPSTHPTEAATARL